MKYLQKTAAWVLSLFLLAAVPCVQGSQVKDSRINIASRVDSALTFSDSAQMEELQLSVLVFLNIHSDTGFFMLDDINNSQWAEEPAVRFTAVDVSGSDSETLALYSKGFSDSSVQLVADTDNLAKAFAEETGLLYEDLSYPFTVILDRQKRIRYAMEGYRAPDVLKECVKEVLLRAPVPQNFSAFCTQADSALLSWQASPLASGYEIWRAEKSGGYQQVYQAASASQNSFSDTGLTLGGEYRYKIRAYIEGAGGKRYSLYTPVLSVKAVDNPSLPLNTSVLSDGRTEVSWSPVSSAEGYKIYRFDSAAGPFRESFTLGAETAPRFTDFADTSYFYLVQPVFDSAESAVP